MAVTRPKQVASPHIVPCLICHSLAGIVYLDLALDIAGLPPHLLPLVPLFCT